MDPVSQRLNITNIFLLSPKRDEHMKITSIIFFAMFAFSTLAHPSPAEAKQEDKEKAGKLFKEGNTLRDQGKEAQAVEKYQAAYKLFPSYKIDLNLASTLYDMGRGAEAAEIFERYLHHGEGEIDGEMKVLALGKLKELWGKLATLRVSVTPEAAQALLDGRVVDRKGKPWPIYLEPGKHKLEVTLSGYTSHGQEFELKPGAKTTKLNVTLKKEVKLADVGPDEKARAGNLFKEGNAFRVQGKHVEALKKYKEAYKLYPIFKIELNYALTLFDLGRSAEAAVVFERYLHHGEGKIDGNMKAEAEGYLAKLRVKLGRLIIVADDAQALLEINGKTIGRAVKPWPRYFAPGTYQIKVLQAGQPPYTQHVTLKAGDAQALKVSLADQQTVAKAPAPEPVPRPRPEPTGQVKDKEPVELQLQPSKVIKPTEPEDKPARGSTLRTIAKWGTLGAAAAFAVTAAVLYGVGMSNGNSAHDAYMNTTDWDEIYNYRKDVNNAEGLVIGGHVLAGLAVAAGVASAVLFLTQPEAPTPAKTTAWGLAPMNGGAAFSISGRF